MRFLPLPRVPWNRPRRLCEDLFDANTPAPLAHSLRGHEVVRSDELEWRGLENGALLEAAAQQGSICCLTCDRNVPYQQNFTSRKLAPVDVAML